MERGSLCMDRCDDEMIARRTVLQQAEAEAGLCCTAGSQWMESGP